jgi:hypothetical protein
MEGFKKAYNPGHDLPVHKAVIFFKGCFALKQYVPKTNKVEKQVKGRQQSCWYLLKYKMKAEQEI